VADTDRELLGLAANATGEKWKWVECPAYEYEVPGLLLVDSFNDIEYFPGWNPLDDDGDALRLAVKLQIDFQVRNAATWVKWPDADGWPFLHHEVHGDDPYAATRRAIVRAAAEIGRVMP
jgi:hypothetical protein